MATATRKVSQYQRLVKAKFKQCAGKATAATVKKAATAYVTDAVKKGKTKTEAQATVNRLMKRGCSVGKARTRKTTARKTTRKRTAR